MSNSSRIVLVLMAFVAMASMGCGPSPRGVDLADMAGWDIVLGADAIASEAYAAAEFQKHFAAAAGITLPIVNDVSSLRRHVLIGSGKALRASSVSFDTDKMGDEDLRIVIRDDLIAIAGGRPRGTLYGVYTFLEDYLAVRFLTTDHTYVPKVGDCHVVGPVDRSYHPPLAFRWSYYGETNKDPVFAARLRCNTVTKAEKLGGATGRVLINHSFYRHISSKKYGKEHPEYFCMVGGKRLARVRNDARDNEPCLTNPNVLRIVTRAVLDEIKRHPNRENVSVSQNDNAKYCRCPVCATIDTREGTPMGSLLTFVNAVADEVAKEHPNVKVGTLSYWYSRKPPKTIRPRPNVQIQLCSIECSVIRPISDPASKRNRRFCADLQSWRKLCDDICIWNYNTNFRNYLLPCPNLRVIEPNIRFFVANNARGIFMQGAGNARGAEMSDLRNYVTSRLLWNPNLSGQLLIDEFLDLHYGKAADPIRRFINLVHDNAEAKGIERNCFGSAKDYGIDESIATRGLEAFAEALRLAEDDAVRARVEKASVCAYRAAVEDGWVWIMRHQKQVAQGKARMPAELVRTTRPHLKRLHELCTRYGVTRWSEGCSITRAWGLWRHAYGLKKGEAF